MIAEYFTRRDAEIYASELTQIYGPDVHFDVVGMRDPVFGDTVWYVLGTRTRPTSDWTTILGLDEGDVEEGGTGGAREATLLKIYVYGYLNRVHSRPRTDFAQDRTKQGKITQARRVPSTV